MTEARTCQACGGTGFNPRVAYDEEAERQLLRRGEKPSRTICVICNGKKEVVVMAHGK